MNTTQMLIDALTAEPDDFCLAAALVEHLEVDCDMWRTEAEFKVDLVQQTGRALRDLDRATKMMRANNQVRTYLLDMIADHLSTGLVEDCTVVVIAGNDAPMCTQGRRSTIVPEWFVGTSVLVGAVWLLRVYRENRHRIKYHRKRGGEEM